MTTEYGFGASESSSTWITINNGKLTVRATEEDEGAKSRTYTTKDGEEKTIWEYQYTAFTGDIVDASFEETAFGVVYSIKLMAGDREYALRLPAPGRLFDQFAKRIPNLNKNLPLYVGAFQNEAGHNVLYLKQDGEKVPMAFTKDNPNGMPAPVKTVKMGKEKWDFSAQEEFLYNLAHEWFPKQEAVEVAEVSPDPF